MPIMTCELAFEVANGDDAEDDKADDEAKKGESAKKDAKANGDDE